MPFLVAAAAALGTASAYGGGAYSTRGIVFLALALVLAIVGNLFVGIRKGLKPTMLVCLVFSFWKLRVDAVPRFHNLSPTDYWPFLAMLAVAGAILVCGIVFKLRFW